MFNHLYVFIYVFTLSFLIYYRHFHQQIAEKDVDGSGFGVISCAIPALSGKN